MRELRGSISGYALPTYILDIPGGYGKVPLTPVYIEGENVIDSQGKSHQYQ